MGYGEREKLRIKYGVCLDCKSADAVPGMRRCGACRGRVNREARKRYQAKKGKSLCVRCKERAVTLDKRRCKPCEAELYRKRWLSYWARKGAIPPA